MKSSGQPSVLVIGPTPPPQQGMTVATDCLLHSSLAKKFHLIHLDTSDRRPMNNAGHLDFWNIYLACKHGVKFLAWLIGKRPDLVYVPIAQNALGFLRDSLFLIPAPRLGAKLIIHLHGGAFDRFYQSAGLLTRMLVRYCLSRVDGAVVLNEKFRNIFGELVPRERIVVVENGIVDDFAPCGPVRRPRQGQPLRVLFLSTLVESKGFMDLLRAVPAVLSQIPGVEFLFVGDGTGYPETERARAWVAERGLQEHIKFLGPKWGEEKKRILLDADVFAFPTWYPYEGQPLVVIEAMSAGLPIVTTRHAAIENTLGAGGALYVQPRHPEDVAAKLTALLGDPSLRAEMGRYNRRRFSEHYTVDCFARNLGAGFTAVLDRTPADPAEVAQAKAAS